MWPNTATPAAAAPNSFTERLANVAYLVGKDQFNWHRKGWQEDDLCGCGRVGHSARQQSEQDGVVWPQLICG